MKQDKEKEGGQSQVPAPLPHHQHNLLIKQRWVSYYCDLSAERKSTATAVLDVPWIGREKVGYWWVLESLV